MSHHLAGRCGKLVSVRLRASDEGQMDLDGLRGQILQLIDMLSVIVLAGHVAVIDP